jgi:hypothetical protein
MNITKQTLVSLAQQVSAASASLGQASATLAQILAGAKVETPAQASNVVPFETPKATTTPAQTSAKFAPKGDPANGVFEAVVSPDARVRLSAAMFGGAKMININGMNYSADAQGRGRAMGAAFGASVGQTVRFMRRSAGVYVTSVVGATIQAQPQPQTQAQNASATGGKRTKKAKSQAAKTQATASALSGFFAAVTPVVSQQAQAGVVNENYAEGDPRRHMTKPQRKEFNRTVAAATRGQGKTGFQSAVATLAFNVPASVK